MKHGGGSRALANQQSQALAAQQAQAALANESVAADSATVQTGGTADASQTATNSLLPKNRVKKGLAGSLGLNT